MITLKIMRGAMSSSTGEKISHFESYYDVFFFFRSCEILQIKPVDVSMKKSGNWFSLFYRFELYFIDRYVYFDFKSSKIDEGNNL